MRENRYAVMINSFLEALQLMLKPLQIAFASLLPHNSVHLTRKPHLWTLASKIWRCFLYHHRFQSSGNRVVNWRDHPKTARPLGTAALAMKHGFPHQKPAETKEKPTAWPQILPLLCLNLPLVLLAWLVKPRLTTMDLEALQLQVFLASLFNILVFT